MSQNLVTMRDGQAFTDSLAVSEGTENEHKAVIQLVRTYLDDFDSFGRVTFEMRPFATSGGIQTREVAVLNEQQATLLLTYMRNTPVIRDFKRKLVHAFFEMAKAKPDPMAVLSDPVALRGLLAGYTEKVIALEGQVAEMEPKVIALNRIADSDGSFSLREAAKACDVPERKFIQALHAKGWIYRHQGGDWLAYSDKTRQGFLTHKLTTVKRLDGSEKTVERVRVTPKGITRLAQVFHASAA